MLTKNKFVTSSIVNYSKFNFIKYTRNIFLVKNKMIKIFYFELIINQQ